MGVGTNRTGDRAAEESRPPDAHDADTSRRPPLRERLRALSRHAGGLRARFGDLLGRSLATVRDRLGDPGGRTDVRPRARGPRPAGRAGPQFDDGDREAADDRSRADRVVVPRGVRRADRGQPALPAGDRNLSVDRADGRLTLRDPDREGAYVSSTVWEDVEP